MEDSRHSLFNEILGRLVRSMLHDLNSPLSSIIGYSSKNISQSLDPGQDWNIVYEQGVSLSENIKFWQSIARQQLPQYDGDVVKVAHHVFRAFKSTYASKIAVVWDDNCENQDSVKINAKPRDHLYFWMFLYNYFVNVLPEQEKAKLKISFCDGDRVTIRAELQVNEVVHTLFSNKIAKQLEEMFDDIVIEREISDSYMKFVIEKLSVTA